MEVIERITVPHTIYQWKQDPDQRDRAKQVQANNRAALESAFEEGLVVVGYDRDAEGNGSFLLGPWNETEQGAWSSEKTKARETQTAK
jgi:predicted GNAT superfamily acetyltransferase